MEEKMFFEENGVSVSNARFIVRGQTYAMSGVTSVKKEENPPSRLVPIALGLIGGFGLFNGTDDIFWAFMFLALAVFVWSRQKSEWIVILNSSSGETQALKSMDGSYIEGVVEALNRSIIYRG